MAALEGVQVWPGIPLHLHQDAWLVMVARLMCISASLLHAGLQAKPIYAAGLTHVKQDQAVP